MSLVSPICAANTIGTMTLRKSYVLFYDTARVYMGAFQRKPHDFSIIDVQWEFFDDGSPNFRIPEIARVAGKPVIFVADFSNESRIFNQLQVLVVLLQSHITELTLVIPFFSHGTMERVTGPGVVATANTTATILSGLPSCGPPTKVVLYDLHTLQSQFLFRGSTVPALFDLMGAPAVNLGVPSILQHAIEPDDIIVFPDDGAKKRYTFLDNLENNTVTCAKTRNGDRRVVKFVHGDDVLDQQSSCVIVDDIINTGGTLRACAQILWERNVRSVKVFAIHGVFSNDESTTKLCDSVDKVCVTNTVPRVHHVAEQHPKIVVIDISDTMTHHVKHMEARRC